jgi:hypothetical protein
MGAVRSAHLLGIAIPQDIRIVGSRRAHPRRPWTTGDGPAASPALGRRRFSWAGDVPPTCVAWAATEVDTFSWPGAGVAGTVARSPALVDDWLRDLGHRAGAVHQGVRAVLGEVVLLDLGRQLRPQVADDEPRRHHIDSNRAEVDGERPTGALQGALAGCICGAVQRRPYAASAAHQHDRPGITQAGRSSPRSTGPRTST